MDDIAFSAARMEELAETAYTRGIYTYTDFLSLPEQDLLCRTAKKTFPHVPYTLLGGTEGCERVLARFGSEELLGYPPTEDPIVTLSAVPRAPKFAEALTHRDVLGALMNLGIRRECVGDILVDDGYVLFFVLEKIAPYIRETLTRIRHTDITVSEAVPPPFASVRTEEISVGVVSLRLDAVVAAAFRLSRTESSALFAAGRVFADGRAVADGAATVKAGSLLTVRGMGRVRVGEVSGTSRKGRLWLSLSKFV